MAFSKLSGVAACRNAFSVQQLWRWLQSAGAAFRKVDISKAITHSEPFSAVCLEDAASREDSFPNQVSSGVQTLGLSSLRKLFLCGGKGSRLSRM